MEFRHPFQATNFDTHFKQNSNTHFVIYPFRHISRTINQNQKKNLTNFDKCKTKIYPLKKREQNQTINLAITIIKLRNFKIINNYKTHLNFEITIKKQVKMSKIIPRIDELDYLFCRRRSGTI